MQERVSLFMEAKTFSLDPLDIPVGTYDEVNLYLQTLPLKTEYQAFLKSLLSKDELERAKRYHFERDRIRFTVARGLLRCILSAYLHMEAHKISFQYGPYGKPYVDNMTVQFNVSHSEDRILIGVGYHHPLGVDIEHISRSVDIADIAKRFFTAREAQHIQYLKGEAQQQAFFNVWTRKEALLKAVGAGLNVSLKACEVSVGDEAFSAILDADIPSFHKKDWIVCRELLSHHYLAAAVIKKGLDVVWVKEK